MTDSFVFILHGEEFIVRENVFVQHLTDVSFKIIISSFCQCIHQYISICEIICQSETPNVVCACATEFFGELPVLFC